jgi:hypothetical protein
MQEENINKYNSKIEILKAWDINIEYAIQNNDLVKTLFFSSKEKREEYLKDWEIYPNLKEWEIKNPLYLTKDTLLLAKQNIENKYNDIVAYKKGLKNTLERIPIKQDFSNIYKEIGKIHIVPFLQKLGYTVNFVKNKNSANAKKQLDERKAKGVTLDINDERYLIYNDSNETYKLFKRDESFKGDLIEFIEKIHLGNYVSSKETKLEAVNLIRNNWAIGSSMDYVFDNKPNFNKISTKPIEKEYTKLIYPQYLISRGLPFNIITAKEVYSSLGNSYNKKYPTKQNIVFKMRNIQNDLFAFMDKNKDQKGRYEKNKSTKGMLFASINIEPVTSLIISETALDLLSIVTLQKTALSTTKLISPNGQVNDGQLEFIKRIIEENPINKIILGNDKDYQGQFFNYKYLKMIYEQSEIKNEDISLNIEKSLNKIKEISIDPSKDINQKEQLKLETILDINESLIKILGNKVEIIKSIGKDFNEDLMNLKGLSREDIIMNEKTELDIYYLSKMIKSGLSEKEYLENFKSIKKENQI